jgi:plastocyanin
MSCTRLLATVTILCSLLLTAVWAFGDVTTKQNADSQMMGAMDAGGIMTSGGMMTTKLGGNMTMVGSKNITSSINLMNIRIQAIESKVNVSLNEAITAAEGIGNNSHAAAAYLGEENGYLVYNIMVIDPSMNFSKVIVDPGNGHMLFSKQLTNEDMIKDEMERHHKMMSMMMGGPQQGRGMMMGPGMMGQGPGQGMMIGEGHDMMRGPQQGRGMMMGSMTAQAQQTDNITSSNATSVLPTTNATTNATSPAAVVSTSEPNATTTVSMAQGSQFPNNPEFYVPAEVTVKAGQTVTWKNDDTAIHTATSGQDVIPDGKFNTGYVPPTQSSKPIIMPTQPGEYPYFCTLHPWMIGTVTVE